MINLDQVRTLEWKVKQAVQLIGHLRKENDTLRGRVSDTEVKLQELESMMESFKTAQSEMESGIRSALEELDHLEAVSSPSEDLIQEEIPETESRMQARGPLPLTPEPVSVIIEKIAPDDEVLSAEPESMADTETPASEAASFEAEFAALVEAEEQGTFDDLTSAEEIPESVELEVLPSEEEDEVVPQPDQQPGLGIF